MNHNAFLFRIATLSEYLMQWPYSAGYPGIESFLLNRETDGSLKEGDRIAVKNDLSSGLFSFSFYELKADENGGIILDKGDKVFKVQTEMRTVNSEPFHYYKLV